MKALPSKRRPVRWIALFLMVVAVSLLPAQDADWKAALPGWAYEFPRDHHPHRDFKTEWWYFTGNLHDSGGRRFGYQLTFFRQGLRPPGGQQPGQSRFLVDDLKFAHFAVTDVRDKGFRCQQKLSRGAFREAGFDLTESAGETRLAWIDDWRLILKAGDEFQLLSSDGGVALDLTLKPAKPWAIHGRDGVSQKAEGAGRASHYYSGSRLVTAGTLKLEGRDFAVSGESWFDHEWATNQLTPEQVGWDWFSLQFDDGSELMLYQMRTKDGGSDPHSSGTFIAPDGKTQHLTREDYQLQALDFWTSRATGGRYPISWRLTVPSLALQAKVVTPVKDQELVLKPIVYWEGLIDAAGMRGEAKIRGHGYLELTGYAGALVGLSSER